MKLLERILVALDFSDASESVIETAVDLAKVFQSKVIPIHILPSVKGNEKAASLLQQAAQQRLDSVVERLKQEGVDTNQPILSFGAPHRSIVQAALDLNPNLILLGSGENRKTEKFQLGTTTERIIQQSEKPIFVVKEETSLNVQQILCPVDFSTTSKRALTNAITLAHRFKAELTILSVCELQGPNWFKSEEDSEKENEDRCAAYKVRFDEFLQQFNLAGLSWSKEMRKGDPAEEILNSISSKMADLLVMGTAGRTGLSRFLIGSVTKKVIREVPCSFLVLHSEDAIDLQLETDIRNIAHHYQMAKQLVEDGFYEEAIDQFKICLGISNMHVPSYFGIAKVFGKLNRPAEGKRYEEHGREVMDKMMYEKIEQEVRHLKGL